MSSSVDTLYFFGDHTGNILQSIQDASKAASHSSAVNLFFQRSMHRLQNRIANTILEGHERYLYKQSPLELAIATTTSDDGGNSAVATALLCIAHLADLMIYLEKYPRALENTATSRNIMVGTCTGLVTAAAVSCCRNLTEILSIADEIVEIAFNIGLEAEKRSNDLESQPLSARKPYTWATSIPQTDVAVIRRTIDELDVPSHVRLYISAFGESTATVSGPPSMMGKLFDAGGLLGNQEKIKLPIRAAFHAGHLNPISWDQLIGDAKPSLLSMSVEHPFLLSSSSGSFIKANTFIDLLMRTCEDILQRPIDMGAIVEGLERSVTARSSSFISFGPESLAYAIRPLLETRLQSSQQPPQPGTPGTSAGPGVDFPVATSIPPMVDPSDIAIIGMGVRLPGSETLEEFWSVLENGRDLHEKIPSDRFDLSTHFDPAGSRPNTTCTPYGVFVERPGYFDRHLFKMSPREARQTDPQQRLLLLATYEALEMAGYSSDGSVGAYPGRRVGSFIGQTSDDWREVNASQDVDNYFIPGGMRAFGPGRLHYHFGWDGPSYSVDTACSGSAAAIQLAVSSLLSKECDMAISGGVNLLTAPDLFAGLCRGGFLSTTGGCNTFDDGADGYCRGDAIGVVVLKRLSDALMDRDVVHAVLRGTMTNHSAEAVSITHPHAGTQERLYSTLLTKLNLTPGDINYVEMHGTGTQAGDATEMTSVINVLARGCRTATNPLYVGSVKPNLGHGEAGSGVTSLIKAVMMLRKNMIPPHIGIKTRINQKLPNMDEFNTRLSMGNTPFLPQSDHTGLRRILVNNFDAAGGNTSMMIQDPPELLVEGVDPRPYHVVAISGKTIYSANENVKRLLDYVKTHPKARLEDIAYTTTARRIHHHSYRQAYAVSSADGLSRCLERAIAGKDLFAHHTTVAAPFVVFAFTGQGCQYASMAAELFNTCPPFQDALENMGQICVSHGFASFLPLITDPDIDLTRTSPVQMQTAIVAIELAMVDLWKYFGVTPDAVIGHSLGEFAALCTAGVISKSTCLYLAGRRGAIMAQRCIMGTHAMLVVHKNPQYVDKYLSSMPRQDYDTSAQSLASRHPPHMCEIACVNSDKSTVVSGPSDQIESLRQEMDRLSIRVSTLKVPFAFHSSQMDVILDEYEAEAEKVSFMPPHIPIASTVSGKLISEVDSIDAGYLRRQTRERVRFAEAIDALNHHIGSSGGRRRVWIEVGPDTPCLNLIRTNLEQFDEQHDVFLPSVRKGKGNWEVLADTMAVAYKAGVAIDWRRYHKPFDKALQLLELPNYAFDLQNYWIQYEGDWCLTKGREGRRTQARSASMVNRPSIISPGFFDIQSQIVNAEEVSIVFTSESSDPRLRNAIQGHRVNGNPLFSSALYAEMAYTAARYTQSLANPNTSSTLCMDLRDMQVSEPLIAEEGDLKQLVLINARQIKGSDTVHILFSSSQPSMSGKKHAKCVIVFGDGNKWQDEWQQCASLVQARIDYLVTSSVTGPTHRILGPMAYKLFSTLVDYHEPYRGMREVYMDSKTQEASARVRFSTKASELFVYHPCWIDSLAHISGFVLNGSDATPNDTVYISHGWKSMRIAATELSATKTYHTYVQMKEDPGYSGVMIGDVYVIEDGHVIALIESIKFRRIKRFQLEHFLPTKRHIDKNGRDTSSLDPGQNTAPSLSIPAEFLHMGLETERLNLVVDPKFGHTQAVGIGAIFDIIAQEVGIDVEELLDHALLADTGIDSLLSLSIAARVKDNLGLELPSNIFLSAVSFEDLRKNLTECFGLRSTNIEDKGDGGGFAANSLEDILCDNGRTDQSCTSIETELVVKANLLRTGHSSTTTTTTLFLFPDGAGRASSYTWLTAVDFGAANLNNIYGLDSPFVGKDAAEFGDVMLGDVVASYIRAIRAIQPHGPYHLGGWSIGGVLAFEAASQLQDVSSLFLIDPPCPRLLVAQGDAIRAMHGFETARQIIDIATLVHDNRTSNNPSSHAQKINNDGMQTHFVGSMQMLEKYHPIPLHRTGLHTTLLWARHGVFEHPEHSGRVADGSHLGSENAASDWILQPRQNYGPNGWDSLLPATSIKCRVVDGDHFSIMKPPAVTAAGAILATSFSPSNPSSRSNSNKTEAKNGWYYSEDSVYST